MSRIDYVIIAVAVAAVISLVVHKVREIKGKGCSGCGGNCSQCGKGCKKDDEKL